MTKPSPLERFGRLQETQCTAEEAGQIALDASVNTLVLTHILPYRDLDYMQESAASVFDGEVVVGRDLLTLPV